MLNTLKIIGLAISLVVLASCGGGGESSSGGGGGGAIYTTQKNNVTTIAGIADQTGSADGTGTAASFNQPIGITTYGTNLYVADTFNNTIRQIVLSSEAVTTITGTALYPLGIATDGTNLYVAEFGNHTVRKIVIATGAFVTIAGTAGTPGSVDGTGTTAKFNEPAGITITPDGKYLYVADFFNCAIRQIEIASKNVTTIAGTAGSCSWTDGVGTAARFNAPIGITITPDGKYLYVSDFFNCTIRQIEIATGTVTTIAGAAGVCSPGDGTGTAVRFNLPYGITTDGTNLYVADSGNCAIRQIEIASKNVKTIAGTAGSCLSADGVGAAAAFNSPQGIATDGTNLYVADTLNSTIRKIY